MFFHAGTDGENIRIKDNILRVETNFFNEQLKCSAANANLLCFRSRLAFLVKCHDNYRSAVRLDKGRILQELILTSLQRNRIHDAFTLRTLQTSFDDIKLTRVDHERYFRSIRLGNQQIYKLSHRGFTVDQTVIHVYVNHVRTIFNLLQRNSQSLLVVTINDSLLKDARSGNVAPFAQVDE